MKVKAVDLRRGSGSTSLFQLALGLSLASACVTDAVSGGSGGGGGTATGSGGRNSSTGGNQGSGGGPGSGGATGTGGAGTGGAASGGAGTGGTGSGGTASGGAGGTPGTGGAGTGGAGAGGRGGSATGGAGGAGGAAAPACPTNATFCSSFEDAGLPAMAVYRVNAAPGEWTRDFALDATRSHAGRASLRVKASTEAGTSGSAYKMLSVPAPMTSFWVRFFMWSDVDLGAVDHNPFAIASGSDDPNDSGNLEFADDAGIAFNFHDDVRWPDGYSRTNRFTLPKGMWHCIEVFYDSGPTRNQQLFINSMPRINITGWPTTTQLTSTFRVFKFGFNELHGPPRQTWYDEVVVAPQRIPCQ